MKSFLLILIITLVLSNACIFKNLLGTSQSLNNELESDEDIILMQSDANSSLDNYWNKIATTKYKLGKLPPTAGSGLAGGATALLKFSLSDMEVPITRT